MKRGTFTQETYRCTSRVPRDVSQQGLYYFDDNNDPHLNLEETLKEMYETIKTNKLFCALDGIVMHCVFMTSNSFHRRQYESDSNDLSSDDDSDY